jgi:hypothetical protein
LVAAREQSRKRLAEEEEPVIKAERKAKRMRLALAPTAAAARLAELACLMLSPDYDSEKSSFGHAGALTDWFLLNGLHADVIPLFERIVEHGEDPEEVPGEVCRQVREGFVLAEPAKCHIDVTHKYFKGNEVIWKVRGATKLCMKSIYDSYRPAVWRIPGESAKSLTRWINKDDAKGFWISGKSMHSYGLRLTVALPPLLPTDAKV